MLDTISQDCSTPFGNAVLRGTRTDMTESGLVVQRGGAVTQTFVVVGGGVGGGTAALALRSEGFAGRIVVVCDEPHAPYSRPPLSKGVLRGEEDPTRVALRPAEWYEKKDIDLRTGVAATALDPHAKTVTRDTVAAFSY